MKKLFTMLFALTLLNLNYSCSDDVVSTNTESIAANEQLSEILYARYSVVVSDLGEGNFIYNYPDGKELKIEKLGNDYVISGNKVGDKVLKASIIEGKNEIQNRVVFQSMNNESSQVMGSRELIYYLKNDTFYSIEEETKYSARGFNDCFASEWRDFCDGFVSCVVQAISPVQIAIAIAIHCA